MSGLTEKPQLVAGGLFTDERGGIGFVNDFDFFGVKRFYYIKNSRNKQVRAWNGHRHESKWFSVIQGRALVAAVHVDNWESPAVENNVVRHVLDADRPSVFFVPPGYANGHMNLTDDTILLVFSSAGLAESQADDVRFPSEQWPLLPPDWSEGGEEHA